MAFAPLGSSHQLKGPFSGPRADLGRRARATDTVIIAAAVIAGLAFGRDVLVPIAMAVLLSFVLAPLVAALTRLRIGRVASVLLTVVVALCVLVGLGTVIGKQAALLSENLPQYQAAIVQKLDTLRSSAIGRGVVEKAADALQGLNGKLAGSSARELPRPSSPEAAGSTDQHFLPVEVHEPAPGPVQILQSILSALLPPLATASIVIIFVIFILFQRGDLRDRFIGLTGAHDLHRTTTALDDAANRLSRYFLALTGINAFFGIAVGAGLWLIGVPNPMLWGIVGGVLRFVPYIGALIAMAFPLALAAAVDPGWSMVVETALLFIVLETAMGQVVEPQLFGHTTGMSPLAIIVAAAFWTLIWGPPGLLLSTPITACLVVLGRHVESLNFIELLLGDKPALSPVESFYQRILAADPDEVAFQAEVLLKEKTLLEYYEEVAMPALALAQIDVSRGVLASDRQGEVCASVERVVDDLSDHVDDQPAPEGGEGAAIDPSLGAQPALPDEDSPARSALFVAGRTPLDQAACVILAQLARRKGVSATSAGADSLTAKGILDLEVKAPDAVSIVFLDDRSMAAIRYAVRRMRKRFPSTPVSVCLWGRDDIAVTADSAQADATVSSLREAIDFCVSPAHLEKSAGLDQNDVRRKLAVV